mmetsp:Transcript_18070/g.40073  ORF Transcript_18070/g.40073 Transcript_18070/m.40073 type:complete len:227 (+) Transcript_18070:830-1510(+)
MNVFPIILRFVSGSITPSSRVRNRSEASTTVRLMSRCSFSRRTTDSASFFRRQALSTMMAWKRLPIAFCSRQAATVLSTPPDTAPITWPVGPTRSLTSLMKSFAISFMFQSVGALHTPTTKFCRISFPRTECVTSGWNCRPKRRRTGSAIAACSELDVCAILKKPSGMRVTLSPWDIHICAWLTPSKMSDAAAAFSTVCSIMARPYSRSVDDDTSPPKWWAISCMP